MLYVEDKCLAEKPLIFRIEECTNDVSTVDANGDNCNVYHEDPSMCGNLDTDSFRSLQMCCACNGGTIGYADMTPE